MAWTNKILDEDRPDGLDGEISTPYAASPLTDDRVFEIDADEPSIRENSHEKRDPGPVEAAEVQRADQTEAAPHTRCSDEPSISVARSSPHSLDPATATASSLPDLGENTLVRANISGFYHSKGHR